MTDEQESQPTSTNSETSDDLPYLRHIPCQNPAIGMDSITNPSANSTRQGFIEDRFTGKDYYDITDVLIEDNWLQLETRDNGHLHFKGVKIGERKDLDSNCCYYNHDSVVWFTDEKSDLWRVTNGQAGYWYPRTYNLKNLKGDYLLYGNVCSWD